MPDIRLNIKFFTALIKLTFPGMFFSYNFFSSVAKGEFFNLCSYK